MNARGAVSTRTGGDRRGRCDVQVPSVSPTCLGRLVQTGR